MTVRRESFINVFLVIAILLAIVQPCLAEVMVTSAGAEDNDFNLELDAGWNLISVPLMPENNSVNHIFSQLDTLDENPVLFWNGKEFISVDTIEPLTGYFVYSEHARSIMIPGSGIEGITKHLSPGWNMVGGHRTTATFDLSEIPNQVTQCPSLSFDGEKYVETTSLSPGKGGWVFVENESVIDEEILSKPTIEILSPREDIYSNETIIFAGHIDNSDVSQVQIRHNGNDFTVPVSASNFSAELELAETNTISVYVTEDGTVYSKEILLDGDHLWCDDEEKFGFDPLNPDSDCSKTEENEAGNGIVDGYEIFDGNLPVFAKVKVGADPFTADSNGNGLTDYFELVKLGIIPGESPEPAPAFMMSDSGDSPVPVSSGTADDPDEDGLSNLEEQTYGTDPLSADTDRDNLLDAYEIQIGTDPLKADSDDDGLTDDCELELGTDPLNPDSNNNGVLDGDEDYLSHDLFIDDTIELSVLGQGYAIGNVSVAEVDFTSLISDGVLASKVYNIDFGQNVKSGELKIKYDPASVDSSGNLSVYEFDSTMGTFLPVESVVDTSDEIVSCSAVNSSKYAVLNSLRWDALFEDPLVETDTLKATCLAGSSDEDCFDAEHYIKAVDERYPLRAPPEVELVEGVDYGVTPRVNKSEWNQSETPSETRFETEVFEIPDCVSSEGLRTTSSDGERYQAVSNGNFRRDMADWSPNFRQYMGYHTGYEIDTYTGEYSSAPCSLSIDLWSDGHTKDYHNYEVTHNNVDLTGVDALTFRYNCLHVENGKGLTGSALEFRIDGSTEFFFSKYVDRAYETNGWESQSIDVSSYTGMHEISFNGYLCYGYGTSSSNEPSRVQFLIDDVSAWSTQEPAAPDTANVRFLVTDSQTGEGVESAAVYCNNEKKYTDSSGHTNDFFLKSNGIYQYRIEKNGYKIHEGLFKVNLGESQIVYPKINDEFAHTGSIYITCDQTNAEVYIDNVFSGHTGGKFSNILEGSHTVKVTKAGFYPESRIVQVSDGDKTHVSFQLTAESGSIEVTSSPTGATVYIDGSEKGTTSESSGTLTIPDVPAGERQVRVIKDGYAPYLTTVTVKKDQTTHLDATLNNDDLDGDNVLDYYEENGFKDGFGNQHTTDPALLDTDGDGLSDGYEAGDLVTVNGKTFRMQRSDPTKADTDGDGLDDKAELGWGTDPFNPDTDDDGLLDGSDPCPLTPEESEDLNLGKVGRAILLGAVFGETGLPEGSFYWMVGDEVASSPYYMVGWIGFSCIPVAGGIADIRDAAQAVINGDAVGAAMNAAGAIPGPGDGVKITGAIACYTGKFPWKARELGVLLSKEILPLVPDSLKLDIWKVSLSTRENTIITKLRDEGYSVSQVQELVVSPLGLTKAFLKKNIDEYNAYEGNLHIYQAGIKKTVLGSGWTDVAHPLGYKEVGKSLNANYLEFEEEKWDWNKNKMFLDLMIDNSDEIILSIHPKDLPKNIWDNSYFKDEIEYLESSGYIISDIPVDGYYRMIGSI